MSEKQRAKQLLVYYIQKAWEAGGLHWDGDNVAEVEGIIDIVLGEASEDASDQIQDHNQAAISHRM